MVDIIELDDPSDLQKVYDGVAEQFMETAWTDWGTGELAELATVHDGYFQADAGPDGVAWPALSPVTVARKGHGDILEDTLALRNSLADVAAGIREVVDEPAGIGITFGTDVPHSIYHDQPSGNRPARRHVGVNEEHTTGVAERAADHAVESLKG